MYSYDFLKEFLMDTVNIKNIHIEINFNKIIEFYL